MYSQGGLFFAGDTAQSIEEAGTSDVVGAGLTIPFEWFRLTFQHLYSDVSV